ncbi:MAG: lysophospholipid acyltransferase family protein [Kiloniellales bacterium]
MPAIRAFLFNVAFFGLTAVLALAYLPLLVLPWRVLSGGVRLWAVIVVWLLRVIIGLRHEVRGADNLPHRPVIVAAKHQSTWETITLNMLLRDPAAVIKKELTLIPVWGWLARRTRHIRVDRRAGVKALREMTAAAAMAVADGRSIVIFPQGTRIAPGDWRPYLPGVAALYGALGLPVVPVALNSGLFWGRRSFVKRPGVITVEFLAPIAPGLDRKAFMRELEHRIETATRRLEEEAVARFQISLPSAGSQASQTG